MYLEAGIDLSPSIHFCGGAGAYPSGHRARGGVHPGQVASPSQGHTETVRTLVVRRREDPDADFRNQKKVYSNRQNVEHKAQLSQIIKT